VHPPNGIHYTYYVSKVHGHESVLAAVLCVAIQTNQGSRQVRYGPDILTLRVP
jgi:hypothetical protein